MRSAFLGLLLLGSRALAGDLNPETVAKVQVAQKKAMDEIAAAHGNKKSSELSSSERRDIIKEQAAAQQRVLDEQGVDGKAFARYAAKLTPAERKEVEATEKALAEKERADKAAAKKPGEIQIQRGFNNDSPVELEKKDDAAPVVEQGIPVEELKKP